MLNKYNEEHIKRKDKVENVGNILRVKEHEKEMLMEKINKKWKEPTKSKSKDR